MSAVSPLTETARSLVFRGNLDALSEAVGSIFGPVGPVSVTQDRIQLFADATDDHQWIHVDADRAASGPFGGTIAHGYLTLSLIPHFLRLALDVGGTSMGVNYGLNKVRFPAPVPSGAQLMATVRISTVTPSQAGARVTLDVVVQADSVQKPVCVAEVVVLYAT